MPSFCNFSLTFLYLSQKLKLCKCGELENDIVIKKLLPYITVYCKNEQKD